MSTRAYWLIGVILGLAVSSPAWAAAPPGWLIAGTAPTHYRFAVDPRSPVRWSKSASIRARPSATRRGFGTLMQLIAATDYRGSRVRFSGYLRTHNAGRAQMWMRVDGPDHQVLAFDNMDTHPVTGTTGWKRYSIVLKVPKNSLDIAFGVLLAGRGTVWAAAFKLAKVGRDVPLSARGPLLGRKPRNLNFEQ